MLATAAPKSETEQNRLVLGIVRRRPLKQIKTSDLPRLIAMCERVAEETAKDKTADKFTDLALRLAGELHLREKGHLPFAPKADNRYTAKDLPEKAVKAIYILEKIMDRFAQLMPEHTENDGLYLLTYTTKEAISAFEKGEAYGGKTRSAYLPDVYRHLLVQIAKNMKDPLLAVQTFTNDTKKLQLLDAAWNASSDSKPEEPTKPIKIVTEGGHTRLVHPLERIAGKRAAFHVYREVSEGKGFEPVWAEKPEDAIAEIVAKYAVAKQKVRVYAVVVCAEKKL